MLGPVESQPFPLDFGSLLALAAVAVVALWVLRRLLRLLLVVAIVALVALPIAYPMLPNRGSGSRSRQTYVADGSMFVDRPSGRASCRARMGDHVGADEDRRQLLEEFPAGKTADMLRGRL